MLVRRGKTDYLLFVNKMVLICENFSLLHPRMPCVKLHWKWFWRTRFLNLVHVFQLFHYYLLLDKSLTLYSNKLESPSPKDAFAKLVEIGPGFWRRRFLNFSMYFCFFINIYPWKRMWSFIWTKLNSLHPRMLKVSSLVDIGSVVLGKKIKMWKVYRWMDNRQYAIRIFHMNFQLRELKSIYF